MLACATLVAVYRCLGRSRKDHAQLRQKILCLGLFPGLIKPKTQKLDRDVHVIVTARRVFAFPSTSGLYAFKQPGYTHYRDSYLGTLSYRLLVRCTSHLHLNRSPKIDVMTA
jgi:hypothetical protein